MKKVILFCILAVLIISLGIGIQLFLIGEPADPALLGYTLTESDGIFQLTIDSTESAAAFKNIHIYKLDNDLHITLRKVLVSPFFSSGTCSVNFDSQDVEQIFLLEELIWTTRRER